MHVLLGLDCAGEVRVLLGREDGAVVGAFRLVVLDLLHDHRGLLLVDQTDGFGDELLRVVLVHGEGLGLDALEDSGGCPARELGSLGHLADQIVANGAALRSVEVVGHAGFRHEADPGFDLLGAPVLSLLALGHGVLQLGDEHLLVDVPDCLGDELLAVERDGVRVLVVDVTPEGLELLLVEVVVERVLTDLWSRGRRLPCRRARAHRTRFGSARARRPQSPCSYREAGRVRCSQGPSGTGPRRGHRRRCSRS